MLKDDVRLWVMLHGLMDAYFDGAFCGCCAGLGGDLESIMRTGGGFGAFAGAGQGLGWLVEWPQVCGGRVLLGLAGAGASHRIARLAWVVVAGETGSLSCAQGEGLARLQERASDSGACGRGHRCLGGESCGGLQGMGLVTGLQVWPGSVCLGRLGRVGRGRTPSGCCVGKAGDRSECRRGAKKGAGGAKMVGKTWSAIQSRKARPRTTRTKRNQSDSRSQIGGSGPRGVCARPFGKPFCVHRFSLVRLVRVLCAVCKK